MDWAASSDSTVSTTMPRIVESGVSGVSKQLAISQMDSSRSKSAVSFGDLA